MFAARGGELVRLRLGRGNLFPLDDEFPTGTDCTAEPGEIEVITSEVAEDDSYWDVTRSRYRARGRRFRRVSREHFQVAGRHRAHRQGLSQLLKSRRRSSRTRW